MARHMKNHYQTLGLNPNADNLEVRQAYRVYASKFHPDKHQGDKFFEEQFKEIKEAYDVLSDPTQRAVYDSQAFPSARQTSTPVAEPIKSQTPTTAAKPIINKPVKTNGFVRMIGFGIAGGLIMGSIFEAADFGDGFSAGFLCGLFLGCCLGPVIGELFQG